LTRSAIEGGRLVIDAARDQNEDALRRFFDVDFAGTDRRNLWAEDALFEMPFEYEGPIQIRGRAAIMEESEEWAGKVHDWRFYDVEIHPTLDPTVFFVTCKAESKDRNDTTWITDFVNYFRVVDGQVVHRKEYFDPGAHPR
jgi:ketosteroid isomerase-like protein